MDQLVFDTDMGNDIDDAFAQAMAAQAHRQGKIKLALTVSSNPNPASVTLCEAINRHYGAVSPLGIHRSALRFAGDANGFCYLTALDSGVEHKKLHVLDGVAALRKALYEAPDASVRVVATGFSSNLAGLLESAPGHLDDAIPFSGAELVRRKAAFLSIMACDFDGLQKPGEFNVLGDIPAMKELFDRWPGRIYVSPFGVGLKICVDWARLDAQLLEANPLKRAYRTYYKGTPGARPSWDQTSMLFALEPDAGHFALSEPGRVEIKDSGESVFHAAPEGNCRLLLLDEAHSPERVNETLHGRFYREP
jgi:inosine-uridine nucleoside N-ribohydrolase